jgi:hypothetical protein
VDDGFEETGPFLVFRMIEIHYCVQVYCNSTRVLVQVQHAKEVGTVLVRTIGYSKYQPRLRNQD